MGTDRSLVRALALAAGDAIVLWRLWPDLAALRSDLAAPQAWVDRVGGDSAAFTLTAGALWLVALWLAVGLSAALASYTPGALGSAARRLARFTLPRVLYRAAAGAAGLGVLLTPVAAAAHTPQARDRPPLPAPRLPTSSVPAPQLPTSLPDRPALPDPSTAQPGQPGRRASEVIVHRGDSLWSLAAAHLGPDASQARIAAAWPKWFAANRAEIGANPDLLTPGQALHVPSEQETP